MKLESESFVHWLTHSVDISYYSNLYNFNYYRCMLYGFILLMISVSLISLRFSIDMYDAMEEAAKLFDSELPPIRIEKFQLQPLERGKASAMLSEHEVIIDPMDSTRQLDSLVPSGIIFHSESMIIFAAREAYREFSYRNMGVENLVINSTAIMESRTILSIVTLVIGGGLRFISSGLMKAMEVFMGFMAISIMGDFLRRQTSRFLKQNIAITALSAPIILETMSALLHMEFVWFYTFYVIVYGIFLFGGAFMAFRQQPEMPIPMD